MEKHTKKANLSQKKMKQERVLNYMLELKRDPPKILEESEKLIFEINQEKRTNANSNLTV